MTIYLNSALAASPKGLSEKEAQARLRKFGYNELPRERKRNIFQSIASVLQEPMLLLLLTCGIIYLFLGDIKESTFLLLSVFVVLGISIYQERKTENALQALRDLSSPRALVIRDGIEKRIAGRELAPDDIVIITEGDRVPADGVLLWSNHLYIDESLLTGEAFAIHKKVTADKNVFSSTLVTKGKGIFQTNSTGKNTKVGQIGKILSDESQNKTHLELEIKSFVKIFAGLGILLCFFISFIYGFIHKAWLEGILAGLSTAIALIPEEFPMVMTIFLAMGAWRLSKIRVLTRKTTAIENLGAISTLCVDKTGTITENKMSVTELSIISNTYEYNLKSKQTLPEEFHELLEYSVLASHQNPFDPMEKAFCQTLDWSLAGTEHIHNDWQLIEEYPLSDELLAMSCVWKKKSSDLQYIIAAKGAPEAIIDLCHISTEQTRKILDEVQVMSSRGLRVLGIAKAIFPKPILPPQQHDFDFIFLGLIGLEDPPRLEVPAAVQKCKQAGIRVIMMTGDYPITAKKIASYAGITGNVLTGSELENINDLILKEKLNDVQVFARMIPEQKLRIVNALKAKGETVAMTGDGVNDAPSLKYADVGIAMGERGTDVAREASDIVLLDDNFASIVAGIEEGRRIYDNIIKALGYIFSIHVPIAGLAFLPVFFNWPLILFPAHIVFLELIIDPACAILFELQEAAPDIMLRKPRPPQSKLFSMKDIFRSITQGFVVLIIAILIYRLLLSNGQEYARTASFFFLILANIGLILTNISGTSIALLKNKISNRLFLSIFSFTVLGLFFIHASSMLRELFHFTKISIFMAAIISITVILSIVININISQAFHKSRAL